MIAFRRACRSNSVYAASVAGTLGYIAFAAGVILLFASAAAARPYDVQTWNQHHDYTADFATVNSDLCRTGTLNDRIPYGQLAGVGSLAPPADIWRGTGTLQSGLAYDWATDPGTNRAPFAAADYDEIRLGDAHCAPTSFAMAHNYWFTNMLPEIGTTIRDFALSMDTNDVNTGMNSGDHLLQYGTGLDDQVTGVRTHSPSYPWGGNYQSSILWSSGNSGPGPADRVPYFGEIRAGRPCKVGIPGHATLGVDYYPAEGARINDPWDAALKTQAWDTIRNYVSMQPQALADEAPGTRVYFSNDNFGTGQANAQAPAGDAGDIWGSSLDGHYGRVLDDVPAGLSHALDYYTGAPRVTNGMQYPFDIGDIDVIRTTQPMNWLTYSLDHGDPNPHVWVPGVSDGNPAEQLEELKVIYAPRRYLTLGTVAGSLTAVAASEDQLGLNRGEWSLPGRKLDDDVDAVELEFDPEHFFYCADYVDTRVYPEEPATVNASWKLQSPFWHQLPEYDPTDIYFKDGTPAIDGETILKLADGTQVDAIQFIWDPATSLIGLLYSVNALGDAPDCRDAALNDMLPGMIYLSWLDRSLPIPFYYVGGDLDAITWSGDVPEPGAAGAMAVLAWLAAGRRGCRRGGRL